MMRLPQSVDVLNRDQDIMAKDKHNVVNGFTDAETGRIARRYGWHINNAMRSKVKGFEDAIATASEGLTPDQFARLKDMVETAQQMKAEYQEAWDALRAAGID